MIKLIKDLKATHGVDVKCVQFDNAGENKAFKKLCKLEGMGVKFE